MASPMHLAPRLPAWAAALLAACALLCLALPAAAKEAAPAAADPALEARLVRITAELRCLVCQNQTIADSNADLATDLRGQVHARIAAGETDAQIRRYVTDRYGDFVLYKPPLTARTVALWVGPFAILLVALWIVLRVLRRRPRAAQAPPPPAAPDEGERLRRLLDEER